MIIVLVGNKADLSDKRQVTLEEATAKSTELNILFMETSAKAGHNVKSLFKKIAMSLPGMDKDGGATDNAKNQSPFLFISVFCRSNVLIIKCIDSSRNRCYFTNYGRNPRSRLM